ncbi:relaxin-3 receptor 1 [Astyanax mexicanus]|uniref:Relaxin-3 receptor 1 n=2 Tax=Astyanax mexicanus TaxID=7994 RepID=A0A8B9KZ30_ASTMX|nr:relaxin-3 receptor 1 [Astyanax mexicanus]KAG9267082.1 relaxin-3 receptor 1-like [Astyanax mexicanus]
MQSVDTPVLAKTPAVALSPDRTVDLNQTVWGTANRSLADQHKFSSLEDIDVSADGSPALRIFISTVYSAVCAVGLVGNLLVFLLMKIKHGRKTNAVNFFVVNLAVTDFQFVLTLPFWAVDTALDFSWPFGDAMCKIILSVTVMNMYASVFFLTAMSITRYWAVASGLKRRGARRSGVSVKWVCAVLWVLATVATAPTSVFSTVTVVAGEKLCLLRFPEGHHWLALYHLQKILIAFILPMIILSICYLMLLRFIRRRSMKSSRPRRRSTVTKSVTVVVLSFFICWMPNHAITLWGVLVKFNAVYWDKTYYTVHTYVFPLTVCLAHTNSCLNPVLYCLMRREFRKMLKNLFWRFSAPSVSNGGTVHPEPDDTHYRIPLNTVDTELCQISTPPVKLLPPVASCSYFERAPSEKD